jgi:hypothetical protein
MSDERINNFTVDEIEDNVTVDKIKHKPIFDEDIDEKENGQVLVIILQCETKACDKNVSNLKWLFSDPYFIVQVCSVDPPVNIPKLKILTMNQYIENYYIKKALNYAAEGPYIIDSQDTIKNNKWWVNIPCIIVKDSSISNVAPASMKKRIQIALENTKDGDGDMIMIFLCKWSDNCNKYIDVNGATNIENGSSLKWSIKPTSSQAVLYIPNARDFVRNKLNNTTLPIGELFNTYINRGELKAAAFLPNIINYDINVATDETDYSKLNECMEQTSASTSTTSTSQWIWLFVIIIVLLVITVILSIFTSRRTIPPPM